MTEDRTKDEQQGLTVIEAIAEAVMAKVAETLEAAHGRFVAGEDEVTYELGFIGGRLKLEGDPNDRETVRMTSAQWREHLAFAHYNGAKLGMGALIRKAQQDQAAEEAAAAAARGDLQ